MRAPDRFARAAAGEPVKGIAAPHPLRRHRRTAAAIIVTAVLALLVAACSGGSPSSAGSGGSSNAGGSTTSPSAVAYSACIRSHGVPNYPDPDSSGQLPKTDAQVLGVSTSQYQAAQRVCRHLLPTGGSLPQLEHQCMQNSDCPPALVQQMMTADLKLARCMRSHGVPSFPDPTNGGSGGPVFNITDTKLGPRWARGSEPWPVRLARACDGVGCVVGRACGPGTAGGGGLAGSAGRCGQRRLVRRAPGG